MSSRTVPKNISAEPKDLLSSAYLESNLESPLNPEPLILPAAPQNTSEGLSNALIKSETPMVIPQTSGSLGYMTFSSTGTRNMTSLTGSSDASEVPAKVDTHTLDNTAGAMGQIDDNTNIAPEEFNSNASTNNFIDRSTQKVNASSTEDSTEEMNESDQDPDLLVVASEPVSGVIGLK